MGIFANSGGPDEMGLHCLLRRNQSSEKEILYSVLQIILTTISTHTV